MNKINTKERQNTFVYWKKKKAQKFFPLTLNHSRDDFIKAQVLRWCVLQVESNWEWLGLLCLLGFKNTLWALRDYSFQKSHLWEQTTFLPPPFFPCRLHLYTAYSQTVSDPHTFLQADWFLLLRGPLPSWLRSPHSCGSCALPGSMKSSERAASSPSFPWIRSWHFNEGKDNVWNPASPGSRPSPCHRTSSSCPSTQHFILFRPPNKQTLEDFRRWLGLWLPGRLPGLWHPTAPARAAAAVFRCCSFVLFFIFMNGFGRNADGSTVLQPFIKSERKQTAVWKPPGTPNCKSLIFPGAPTSLNT